MRFRFLVILLLLIIANFDNLYGGIAQDIILPNDLMFTVGKGNAATQDSHIPNIIVHVDRSTLQTTIFYEDSTAIAIYPISWSPNGSYLAIFRITGNNPYDLDALIQTCILTSTGVLHICFAETIAALNREDLPYIVTWSPDSSKVYFLIDQMDERHLVEGDVETGEITRTVFTYTNSGGGFDNIIWSPTLEFVVYNTGNYYGEALRIELNTRESTSLSEILPSRKAFICPDLSPQNMLMVGIPTVSLASHFILVDQTGQSLTTQTFPEIVLSRSSCPLWSMDESVFYFLGETAGIETLYRYSSETLDLVTIPIPYPVIPLALSPDGSFLAFLSEGGNYISVLFPDGTTRTFGTEYLFAEHPLWVPLR